MRYYDVRRLFFKRAALPKDAPERRDLEDSIRFIYRWQPEREFRALLFLTDCVGLLGRAIASVLVALGLNGLRWKTAETLKGDY